MYETTTRWSTCLAAFLCLALSASAAAIDDAKPGDVSEVRVQNEFESGANWLLWGRDFASQHHSPLANIDHTNVSSLGLAWAADIDSPYGLVAEPIVVDGVIYISGALARVYAVDATNGALLWKFEPKLDLGDEVVSWLARVNRGVAVWKGRVYVGTGDCRLIAVDAKTGGKVWESRVCEPTEGSPGGGITGAPQVGDDKIFIGYATSEAYMRGSIAAFDAESGKELWRFWTVPGDPAKGGFESPALEMASKTWSDGWAKKGGGTVYDAITYDPVTDLVYFGTSSARPLNARLRDPKGLDNLFSNSIVAVKADSGEYAWHYQTVPFDAWSYDANWHLMIAKLPFGGRERRVVMQAPKNGFLYVLDAQTGELLAADAIAKVTWASHVDLETGRPVERPEARYHDTAKDGAKVVVAPSPTGGHSWAAMSFDPKTGLLYIPVSDLPGIYAVGDDGQGYYELNGVAPGTVLPDYTVPEKPGRLLAWDPVGRKAVWSVRQPLDYNGGVLSTAGGLVFQGTAGGDFMAYSADGGQELWRFESGSSILAAPVSYSVGKEQVVLIPVGQGGGLSLNLAARVTALRGRGPTRLLAFKLGGSARLSKPEPVVMPMPPEQTAGAETIAKGEKLFKTYGCDTCHGTHAMGIGRRLLNGGVPDLRYAPTSVHTEWHAIVIGGSRLDKGMPRYSELMTIEESSALQAFVVDQAWKEFKDQRRVGARGE